MKFSKLVLFLPLLLLIALSYGCDNESSADTTGDETEPRLFFVHRSNTGTLEPITADRMLLTLEDVSPITSFFSDRPSTRIRNNSTEGALTNHFYDLSDPTEAVLEIYQDNGTTDVISLTVHDLDYDMNTGVIQYEVSLAPELPEVYVNPNDQVIGMQSEAINQSTPMEFDSNSILLGAANQNPPLCSKPLTAEQLFITVCMLNEHPDAYPQHCVKNKEVNPTGKMSLCCRYLGLEYCCESCPING